MHILSHSYYAQKCASLKNCYKTQCTVYINIYNHTQHSTLQSHIIWWLLLVLNVPYQAIKLEHKNVYRNSMHCRLEISPVLHWKYIKNVYRVWGCCLITTVPRIFKKLYTCFGAQFPLIAELCSKCKTRPFLV